MKFGDSNRGGNDQGFGRGGSGNRGGDGESLFGRRRRDVGSVSQMGGSGHVSGGRGGQDRGGHSLRTRQSRWGDKEDGGETKGVRTRRSTGTELNGASAGPVPLMANFQPGGQPNFNAPPPGYQSQSYGNQMNNFQGNSGGIPSLMNGGFNYQQVAGQPPLPRN